LISEGLDVPTVGCVILLRPTKSLVLHFQQLGRGMRPAPGKAALIALDHAGNVARHGRPEDPRQWSLGGVAGAAAPVRVCPACGAVAALAALGCPHCGHEFPRPAANLGSGGGRQEPDRLPGELRELSAENLRFLHRGSYRHVVAWANGDGTRLEQIAAARGYRRGWVWHQLRGDSQ
jgi:superfamily II DNA or RNA helicase